MLTLHVSVFSEDLLKALPQLGQQKYKEDHQNDNIKCQCHYNNKY